MAELREIAQAIKDDMRTSGHEFPEIARAQGQLKLTIEVELRWFEPAVFAKLAQRERQLSR